MISSKALSRRGFLNMGAMAGASLLLPKSGLIRPAYAQSPLPPVAEADAVGAWALVGPIADEGWNWAHNEGRLAVEAAFPQMKTLLVESVPYSADAQRTFRQFVAEGSNIIFATSNYGDFLQDVARRAPDVAFYECNGYQPTDNLGWYYLAHWYPSYVTGIAAGMMSPSGKLGYVASYPVPSVYSGSNAFLMGARTVNPEATMQTIVINSWFDPQGATQAATALIDNGADVLFGIMDEAAYLQVAEQRGKKAVMWNTDIRRFGPEAYISSIIIDFRDYYVDKVGKRLAGEWTPTTDILPFGGGVDRDPWGETVPQEAATKADEMRDRILGGYNPFVGPIKDVSGEVRVAEGETMSEMDLYTWNWSIEGVSGLDD